MGSMRLPLFFIVWNVEKSIRVVKDNKKMFFIFTQLKQLETDSSYQVPGKVPGKLAEKKNPQRNRILDRTSRISAR